MRKIGLIIFTIVFILSSVSFSQNSGSKLTIIGDSLKGKVVDGLNIREVLGHVVITQDDIRITCNKAIQYLSTNVAELIGNVVLTQDSVIIKTNKGRYFGNSKMAFSDTTVRLTNGKLNLLADKGNYNLNTKIAKFFGNVNFTDSLTDLNSSKLIYFKNSEKIIAVDSVRVSDTTSVIFSDSLIHLRRSKFSEGYGNIKITSTENNIIIFGDTLLDDKQRGISKVTGNPFLTQIEELNDGTFDTLFIKSKILESKKDSSSKLVAIDSVEIIRGDFYSVNDYTIYDKDEEQILIFRQADKSAPILWYENTQAVGDSIYINLDSSKIKNVEIIKDGLLVSEDSTYRFRYDQMSGDTIHLSFINGKLVETDVKGNVLSIYYMYEEREPNGLLKSSAKEIKILFENSKVTDVKMFGSPMSEYHPENLVEGNEKAFTLPTFIVYNNKPDKKKFMQKYKSKL